MKVVILAGGLGSRLSEYTKSIPKPIKVLKVPIIVRIINFIKNLVMRTLLLQEDIKVGLLKII